MDSTVVKFMSLWQLGMLRYDIMMKLCFDISIQFLEKWVFNIDLKKVLWWGEGELLGFRIEVLCTI